MVAAVQEKLVNQQQSFAAKNRKQRIVVPDLPGGGRLRRFSLDEYHQLVELGFFHEDERIELYNGLLVEMSPINPRHAECVDRAAELFMHGLFGRARVRVQSPITLDLVGSEPQPDITVATLQPAGYGERHPHAGDVLLVVEVADSSLEDDRGRKLATYASAGIPEYWIFNLIDGQLEVYREPTISASGYAQFKTKLTLTRDQVIAPLQFPDCQIDLSQILPE